MLLLVLVMRTWLQLLSDPWTVVVVVRCLTMLLGKGERVLDEMCWGCVWAVLLQMAVGVVVDL